MDTTPHLKACGIPDQTDVIKVFKLELLRLPFKKKSKNARVIEIVMEVESER